jgi:hypothetical protein
MKALHIVSFILLVIGGLNWLLVAFGWNLVDSIFGAGTIVSKAIYVLVGIAAIVEVVTHGKNCKTCNTKAAM